MAGKLVHFELPAQDSARAKEFYGSLFGWQFQSYGEMDYHMLQVDDQQGGAISGMQPGENATIYFDVDDIDEAVARVRKLGGKADDRQPIPGIGWFSRAEDTEGNRFSLYQDDSSAPGGE